MRFAPTGIDQRDFCSNTFFKVFEAFKDPDSLSKFTSAHIGLCDALISLAMLLQFFRPYIKTELKFCFLFYDKNYKTTAIRKTCNVVLNDCKQTKSMGNKISAWACRDVSSLLSARRNCSKTKVSCYSKLAKLRWWKLFTD